VKSFVEQEAKTNHTCCTLAYPVDISIVDLPIGWRLSLHIQFSTEIIWGVQ